MFWKISTPVSNHRLWSIGVENEFSLIREELISGDFGQNMRLLQNTSEVLPDIQVIIRRADEIREKDARRGSATSSSLPAFSRHQIGKRLKNFRSSLNSKTKKLSDAVGSIKPNVKNERENLEHPVPERSASVSDATPKRDFLERGRQSFKSLRIKMPDKTPFKR